ncbi:unnamed protein product [Clonostachys chloroleuca]|uniref:Uncharacterized protein n=1 Tax=Clonostachys chloroleuca TaxID=1926264 RepID=A0AA35MHI3_9HYPO|nr:unnamed protein product [Clonostachys chloroleuca]
MAGNAGVPAFDALQLTLQSNASCLILAACVLLVHPDAIPTTDDYLEATRSHSILDVTLNP